MIDALERISSSRIASRDRPGLPSERASAADERPEPLANVGRKDAFEILERGAAKDPGSSVCSPR